MSNSQNQQNTFKEKNTKNEIKNFNNEYFNNSNTVNSNGSVDNELIEIAIKNAKENNLKNVSLNIPREKFIVITGPSGSGKSSLAFDTIYAEGQRRYIECLSSYAKQFIGMMKKPNVDSIEGLSPSIAIEQKTLNHNPRSSVGTITEIYDYIRLLFAKVGTQYCVNCDVPVIKRTHSQIIGEVFNIYKDKSILILAPLIYARKGQHNELFISLIAQGFTRVRVDGQIMKLDIEMNLSRYKNHDIELIVDKCVVDSTHKKRVEASIELALKKTNGTLMIIEETEQIYLDIPNNKYDVKLFSTNYACPSCNTAYRPLAPNMFSFNSPYGACPKCNGVGRTEDFDEDLLIPNKEMSIVTGAIKFLGPRKQSWLWSQLIKYAEESRIPLDIPVKYLEPEQYKTLMWGNDDNSSKKSTFNGFIPNLRNLYNEAYSYAQQRELNEYRKIEDCSECAGIRLKKTSAAVKIYGISIKDIVTVDIQNCFEIFTVLEKKLKKTDLLIANIIIKEIKDRLNFLINVGLSYFSLNRSIVTLSGGEAQRIRLASQIGSQLVGITYVLDEPSIGLHQHDNNKLIKSLKI